MSHNHEAVTLLSQVMSPEWLHTLDEPAPNTIYTPFVVSWLLVYQRLHAGAPLSSAVSEFLNHFPNTTRRQPSANTAGYSRARHRFAIDTANIVADRVASGLLQPLPPAWHGRHVYTLDGTTLTLASNDCTRTAYPPTTNQYGTSHWPIMLVLTAHELSSGIALRPEYGPKNGDHASSEMALTLRLLPRLPAGCLVLADSNFGIFAVANAVQTSGRDVLARLTAARFRSLQKRGVADGRGCWKLTWRPSRADRRTNAELPKDAAVTGWLYEVPLNQDECLWLFSTIQGTPSEWAELYQQRWNVETDIRDLKQTLAMDRLDSRSDEMAHKELVMGIVGYNLVNQVRRLAAAKAKVEPRRLSFAGVWTLLRSFMETIQGSQTPAQLSDRFEQLLVWAGQRKLPNRPKRRHYPRTLIPRARGFPTCKPKPAVAK